MKSTFKNEPILGTRTTLIEDAPEMKSEFKSVWSPFTRNCGWGCPSLSEKP